MRAVESRPSHPASSAVEHGVGRPQTFFKKAATIFIDSPVGCMLFACKLDGFDGRYMCEKASPRAQALRDAVLREKYPTHASSSDPDTRALGEDYAIGDLFIYQAIGKGPGGHAVASNE